MKKLVVLGIAIALCAALGAPAIADGKEVTLEGKVLCAKCSLSKQKECQNVLVVGDEDEVEYFYLRKNDTYNDMGEVCEGSVRIRVTGTIEQEEDRNYLLASEITLIEEKG
jgi:hypothetical protein